MGLGRRVKAFQHQGRVRIEVAGGGGAAFDRPGSGAGDRIDLSTIDANLARSGNQAFVFGGTTAGHLRLVNNGTSTELLGNTDRDVTAEIRILLQDGATLANAYGAPDFVL